MIEVVIDFDKCPENKKDFILCLCNIFHIPRVFGWDAFRDNLWDMFDKVPPKVHIYSERDKDRWATKEIYDKFIYYANQLGPKDKYGNKDDIKLILKNFYPFYKKYKTIADDFLEIFLEVINISSEDDEIDEWYRMIMCIES